jgi:hypothetical protein
MMYFDCINFDRCDSGKFGKYMACIGRCENCPYYEPVKDYFEKRGENYEDYIAERKDKSSV